jgi:glycosyltransferase involved in cell wall biosynthesis
MNIVIISPYLIEKVNNSFNTAERPIPWTHNLAYQLSKIDDNVVHIITGISPRIKTYPDSVKDGKVEVHLFKTAGRFSPYFFYWYEIKQIKKILFNIQPDIVHAQGLESFCGLAASRSGYPNVITVHGVLNEIYMNEKTGYSFVKYLERKAIKKIENFIVINPYVEIMLKKYSNECFKEKKMYPIPNAVSQTFFKAKHKAADGTINIFYSGVFRERKGLKDLMKALEFVKNENFMLHISGIVGNDTESQRFYKEIKYLSERQLKNKVKFLGFIPHDQMAEKLSKMDILVIPSKAETAPMIISEAMAVGLPIVAYDVGGIRYMVANGENGYVVPLNDVKKLGEKISELVKSQSLRKNMGKISGKIAEKSFGAEYVAKRTLKAYESILSRED